MKNKTLLLALVVMMLWGSLYPTVKLGFSAYGVKSTADILLFAGIRFTICGIIIAIISLKRDVKCYSNVKSVIFPILLSGLVAIVLHYGFNYVGLNYTDSSKAALLKQVGALLYVCFSFVFIKDDKPSAKKIISATLGFLGIIALNITSDGITFSIGDVLILCSSFCTIFSNVISKKIFATTDPITATGISQFFGGAVLVVIGKNMGGSVKFAFDLSLWVIFYVCLASVLSYCIWYSILKNGELSRLFIIKFSESIFACIFGVMLLGENVLNLRYLVAFILIGSGIVISNLRKTRKIVKQKM